MDTALKDKVILITGAAGGIGGGLARAFAAEGSKLVLHYHRHLPGLSELKKEYPALEALAVSADLRREAAVKKLFAQAVRRFGRVDCLVANAGIWVEAEVPLHQMTLAQWRSTLETDLTSVFLCGREYFRLVAEQRRGSVVLVGSTAGVFGEAGHADYAAAKSALAYGLTRTLKNEISRLAPPSADYGGGRVNCVCPGWTVTPMTQKYLDQADLVRKATATMALPRMARIEDVANAIVFLASDRLARHLTGQTLVVAGGMEGRWLWQPGEIDLSAV
jgi:3-oxoacyl-[acyl-carrier protein] reductase